MQIQLGPLSNVHAALGKLRSTFPLGYNIGRLEDPNIITVARCSVVQLRGFLNQVIAHQDSNTPNREPNHHYWAMNK